MRRTVLLGPLFAITLALPACAGMDDFLANTFSLGGNPNKPIGDSLTMRRVQGLPASAEPVSPQPDIVWPRGVDRMPTLQDIESERAPAPRSSGNPRTGALRVTSPVSLAANINGSASLMRSNGAMEIVPTLR
ncbi:MAG: hypothetical protein EXR01_04230 [Acetobacteraceae bacterium]|nr:hypothetical protein [Acetobacteraceae bacterium]